MSDAIRALEALRDTAPFDTEEEWCKRAIAVLRDEQPAPAQACAGFECRDIDNTGDCARDREVWPECICRCGQPLSAHQTSEQPGESASGTTCVKCGGVGIAWDDEGDPVCGAHLHREQPACQNCEHCSGLIGEDDEFVITADDYWLHRKCAVERPAHPQPCPDGEDCPDARRYGSVHTQPSPKVEVPPMPVAMRARVFPNEFECCEAYEVRALHAAAVALAERCEDTARTAGSWHRAFMRAAKEADEARAQLAEAQAALREAQIIPDVVMQAALRDARRQERERCAKVVAKRAESYQRAEGHLMGFIPAKHHALTQAAAAIRALPEEVEK